MISVTRKTETVGRSVSVRRITLLLAALLLAPGTALSYSRPASYAGFDTSVAPGDATALKRAIESGQSKYLYVQNGYYILDNPVVIDRSESLYLHGQDRMYTRLVAKNPSLPLFVVRNAPLLNFASLHFWPTGSSPSTLNARAILTQNTDPLLFQMLDCELERSSLEIQGPGFYHLQAPKLNPGGRVPSPILIDHPGADVLVFGGDSSNGREPLRVGEYAHIWQKRGRLRLYAAAFEGGLGAADVRIESASAQGPHVIANVRSEGVNGALNHSGAVSRLLYVPPTSELVDVVLKSNGGAWLTGPDTDSTTRNNCKLASYNGAGTLWMVGNRADNYCGLNLVEGSAPQATIVSIGNLISSPQPFAVNAKRIISAEDLFNRMHWTSGDLTNPLVRWIPDGLPTPKLSSYPDVPSFPKDLLPPALTRPVLTAALPGMIDVKAPPYRARGDGATDDTGAIQAALNANCDGKTPKTIYFPAGSYRISRTLYLNHHMGFACRNAFPYGGWIAGAGSGRTFLVMAPGLKKGVFATDGMAAATIQGITFKTWSYRAGDPEESNFDIEAYPEYIASQFNTFYDVVFDGGFGALALGVVPPSLGACSSNAVFGGVLKNAHIGLISGHSNALANGVYGSQLLDNDYAMGSWTTDRVNLPPGGTFYGYDSVSAGTRIKDFLFAGAASGSTWYFHGWTSDAPGFFVSQATAASWPLFFDRAHLEPRAGAPYLFDLFSSMGPIFLHSTVTRSAIRLGDTPMGQRYAIKIASQIPDWTSSVVADGNGQLDSLDWSTAGAPGPPAAPRLMLK